MEEKKLWNGSKKSVSLRVSLSGKRDVMHIYKDVIRVLGAPEYISIRLAPKMDSLLIEPCGAKDPLPFKVPDDLYLNSDVAMRLSSQSFVKGLMIHNDMDIEQTYRIIGTYIEEKNAVVFRMADKELFEGMQE